MGGASSAGAAGVAPAELGLIVSSIIWTCWTLAILAYVVHEVYSARREYQRLLVMQINGALRRVSRYTRRAAYHDLWQVIGFLTVVVLAVAADGVYDALPPGGDTVYRNLIRGVLIVSLIPMLLRVRERKKLRADMRESDGRSQESWSDGSRD